MASNNASSAFEALRETVYAEVATLISQNESCPHYLIELFRQLQMLSTDFLRQRGLFAIQDIVARYFAKVQQWADMSICKLWSYDMIQIALYTLKS